MAYVQGFERDVFVSYAHADNQPLRDEAEGWVTKFHRSLVNAVNRLIRAEGLEIWRDPKLTGNDEFDDVLEGGVRSSALMISVLTPNYVESRWCRRELDGFSAAALDRYGLRIGDKNRVFKVMPLHLPRERHPEELGGALGYQFYALDPVTQEEEEFRRTNEQDADQRYWRALNSLARDVADLLRAMKKVAEGAAQQTAPAADAPTVYLAEVTDDLLDLREQVRSSLEQEGVRVLPEVSLPYAAGEFAAAVGRDVARSALSVHMAGPYYGRVPGGDARSLTRIQYEAARAAALPRLAWVKLGPDGAQPPQAAFIRSLEQEPESGSPLEVLKCGLEELKELILERVRPKVRDTSDNPFFYISCTPDDSEKAQRLLSCLREGDYEGVVSPVGGADEQTLRKHHRANLKRCDVFVTVYGEAAALWVQEKLLEARAVAARRKKQKMTLSVCAWPPPRELGLALKDLRLWNVGETFRCDEVKQFIRTVRG